MTGTLTAAEVRSHPSLLRLADVDATGRSGSKLTRLHGRAVPYEVWGDTGWCYLERFTAGAFARSIKGAARGLPLLLWHDARTWPVGRSVGWESTDDGLWGEWELDGSVEAQRAGRQARDGSLSYLSVGFAPLAGGSVWEFANTDGLDPDDPGTFDRVTRTQARLIETSLCSTPVFATAEVASVRHGRSGAAGVIERTAAPTPRLAHWRSWRGSI